MSPIPAARAAYLDKLYEWRGRRWEFRNRTKTLEGRVELIDKKWKKVRL